MGPRCPREEMDCSEKYRPLPSQLVPLNDGLPAFGHSVVIVSRIVLRNEILIEVIQEIVGFRAVRVVGRRTDLQVREWLVRLPGRNNTPGASVVNRFALQTSL